MALWDLTYCELSLYRFCFFSVPVEATVFVGAAALLVIFLLMFFLYYKKLRAVNLSSFPFLCCDEPFRKTPRTKDISGKIIISNPLHLSVRVTFSPYTYH